MKYLGVGASARGLVRCYLRPMDGGSEGMLAQENLKATILETHFLAFWGTEFYRIPKVVKYVEDTIFS